MKNIALAVADDAIVEKKDMAALDADRDKRGVGHGSGYGGHGGAAALAQQAANQVRSDLIELKFLNIINVN